MKKFMLVLTLLFLGVGPVVLVSAAPTPYNTWVQTSINLTDDVKALAFSPNYAVDHTVFAAAYVGVFKSTDGGFTWGTTPLTESSTSLAFSPNYASDHTLFAGSWDSGLFKTTITNILSPTWSIAGTPLNTSNSFITSLAFSTGYADDHVIFASDGNAWGGIYKSSNGGEDWTAVTNGLPPETIHRTVMALAISPNFLIDHTLFAGITSGEGVYKSTDSGNSWVFLSGTENFYIQSLAISPSYAVDGTVFAGEGGGGCYLTTDGGASWRAFNAGFGGGKDILSLAIPPNQISQPFNVFAGTPGGTDGGVWQMLFRDFKLFLPLIVR